MYQRENYGYEYYPPPYDAALARNLYIGNQPAGLGCAGKPGCGCGQGMGDGTDFLNSLTSGSWSEVLTGNDFFTGIPNWIVIAGGLWLFAKIYGDITSVKRGTTRTVKAVKGYSARARKRRKLQAELEAA